MISLVDLVTSNGYAWRVLTDDSPVGELRLSITESGLGTLKIDTDAPLDIAGWRRVFEAFVVRVFDANLASKVQVVAILPEQITALEKTAFAPATRQPAVGRRLVATKLGVAQAMALATMARHIDLNVWGFRFDNGKRRAGQCNYTLREISISKHLVAHNTLDEVQQVVLHEIAHAMVGKDAGHGPVFKKQAAALGYRGHNFTGREIAANQAPWVGHCKAGHVHYRYRKPTRPLSCGLCDRTFSRATQIVWQRSKAV